MRIKTFRRLPDIINRVAIRSELELTDNEDEKETIFMLCQRTSLWVPYRAFTVFGRDLIDYDERVVYLN